jgi:hypothetical protein
MPARIFRHPAALTIMFTAPAAIAAAGVVGLTVGWLDRDTGLLPALVAAAIPTLMVPIAIYPLARSRTRLGNPDQK